MAVKFRAKFDGHALRPSEPVTLKAEVEYEVTVKERKPRRSQKADEPHILDRIYALATDMGVTDLAEHHDDYALGRRKLPEALDGTPEARPD
jgi:hypothetical protein